MRHAELQHCRRPGNERHRCDPRATRLVAVEWNSDREGPSLFQVTECTGESREPCCPLRHGTAGDCELFWDGECHAPFCGAGLLASMSVILDLKAAVALWP